MPRLDLRANVYNIEDRWYIVIHGVPAWERAQIVIAKDFKVQDGVTDMSDPHKATTLVLKEDNG
jgi:hypothetical protein